MADPGFISTSVLGIAAPGVTTYNAIPITGLTIERDSQEVTVDIFDATRQKSALVGGAASWSVNLTGALNYEVGLQDLLKYTVGGSWTADVLLPSDTNNKAAVTFDLGLKIDLATDDYVLVEDCIVGSFAFSMPLQGPATWTAQIIGTTASIGTVSLGTFNNLAGLSPFAAGLTGSGITWNAAALEGVETAAFTITNAINPKFAWGSTNADHVTLGNMNIVGNAEQYYRASTMFSAGVAETIDDLVITMKSSETTDNTMAITFTKAKITRPRISNSDTTFTTGFNFTSQYDATNKKIKIAVT